RHWQQVQQEVLISDKELPVYSILVPMLQEKESTIRQLINALKALDYPKHKLEVKFILEADDSSTRNSIKVLRPPHFEDMITIPRAEPRTKPKACNYALRHVRGEYVTIYDAEDIPDPQQLRKVLAIFRQAEGKVGCVQ